MNGQDVKGGYNNKREVKRRHLKGSDRLSFHVSKWDKNEHISSLLDLPFITEYNNNYMASATNSLEAHLLSHNYLWDAYSILWQKHLPS